MKYLIFGSSGFLGKKLVYSLRSRGEEVIAVQRKGSEKYNVDLANQNTFYVLKEIEDIDIIINCASLLTDASKKINDVKFLEGLYQTNVLGSINILNFAAQSKINRVINCSTLAINNKPWPVPLVENYISYPTGIHTGYASSKLMQELMMNEVAEFNKIQLLHLRISALYGEDMKWYGIIPLLIDKAINNDHISLTNASNVSFDFLYINDLVQIIHLISKKEQWNYQVVNTASGEEVYLKELAEKIIFQTKSGSKIDYKETDENISRSVVDISLLKAMLGNDLKMTSIEEGIKQIILQKLNNKECVI